MTIDERLYQDALTFGRAMVVSRDLDPIYDMLRALYAELELDHAARLWFTALYLAYYDLPSALTVFRACPEMAELPSWALTLPIAVERRNLRGGLLPQNLLSYRQLCTQAGGQYAFLTRGWGADPEQNFLRFWETAQRPWGNGRWAAFKWADLVKNVHGAPLAAPDMRLEECSGPKEGLQRLYRTATEYVPTLNRLGSGLRDRFARDGLLLDWEQLETVLCNFKSLAKGKYYVGHDIDELQERIDTAPRLSIGDRSALYTVRREALPIFYLGEWMGWHGIQEDRMRAYAGRGEILVRTRQELDARVFGPAPWLRLREKAP